MPTAPDVLVKPHRAPAADNSASRGSIWAASPGGDGDRQVLTTRASVLAGVQIPSCVDNANDGPVPKAQAGRGGEGESEHVACLVKVDSGNIERRNPLVDNADVLRHLAPFIRADGFLFIGGVSKRWREAWGANSPQETNLSTVVESPSRLSWARQSGCCWDEIVCAQAAEMGKLETLQYARAEGCAWGESTCIRAARAGHLPILQWARAHRCPWSKMTTISAAFGGQLEVLQWCKSNGCAWDETTCESAALGGNFEVSVASPAEAG